MKVIKHRLDQRAENVSRKHGIPLSKVFTVTLNAELSARMQGQRISHEHFMGPQYDFKRQGLIVRGKGTFLNEYFFYSDAPIPTNMVEISETDDGIGMGYAYAFSNPPYPLRLSEDAIGQLFEQINSFILGGFNPSSTIFQWPTNWSNYFDAGNDWWGSFLWTLFTPAKSQIAVIAASSTD